MRASSEVASLLAGKGGTEDVSVQQSVQSELADEKAYVSKTHGNG